MAEPGSEKSVWDWRSETGTGRRAGEGLARLRRAAWLQVTVMAGVGAFLYFLFGHRLVGQVVWGLAAVCLLLGTIHPPAYRPVHRFGRWLGRAGCQTWADRGQTE